MCKYVMSPLCVRSVLGGTALLIRSPFHVVSAHARFWFGLNVWPSIQRRFPQWSVLAKENFSGMDNFSIWLLRALHLMSLDESVPSGFPCSSWSNRTSFCVRRSSDGCGQSGPASKKLGLRLPFRPPTNPLPGSLPRFFPFAVVFPTFAISPVALPTSLFLGGSTRLARHSLRSPRAPI